MWRGFRNVPALMFWSWALSEIWIIDISSALFGILMTSSSKLGFFFEQCSFKLRRETVIGIVLCYSHHVVFFTICPKLPVTMVTMTFTCTFPDVFIFVVSDLKKNTGGSTDLAEKRHWSGGFAYPYSLVSFAQTRVFKLHSRKRERTTRTQ